MAWAQSELCLIDPSVIDALCISDHTATASLALRAQRESSLYTRRVCGFPSRETLDVRRVSRGKRENSFAAVCVHLPDCATDIHGGGSIVEHQFSCVETLGQRELSVLEREPATERARGNFIAGCRVVIPDLHLLL